MSILDALKQSVWTNTEGKQRSKVVILAWNAEFFSKPSPIPVSPLPLCPFEHTVSSSSKGSRTQD